MRLRTDYDPTARFRRRWSAIDVDTKDSPIGYGETRLEAIRDCMSKVTSLEHARFLRYLDQARETQNGSR